MQREQQKLSIERKERITGFNLKQEVQGEQVTLPFTNMPL
jgi:hypothetical protein